MVSDHEGKQQLGKMAKVTMLDCTTVEETNDLLYRWSVSLASSVTSLVRVVCAMFVEEVSTIPLSLAQLVFKVQESHAQEYLAGG